MHAGPAITTKKKAAPAALIKESQNPVGNITLVQFQNNLNYGYGPYIRGQYNLNFQPVVPIELKPDLSLVARIATPFVDQPSSAPSGVCASTYGGPSTFGIGDLNPQFFIAPKTKPNALRLRTSVARADETAQHFAVIATEPALPATAARFIF